MKQAHILLTPNSLDRQYISVSAKFIENDELCNWQGVFRLSVNKEHWDIQSLVEEIRKHLNEELEGFSLTKLEAVKVFNPGEDIKLYPNGGKFDALYTDDCQVHFINPNGAALLAPHERLH